MFFWIKVSMFVCMYVCMYVCTKSICKTINEVIISHFSWKNVLNVETAIEYAPHNGMT